MLRYLLFLFLIFPMLLQAQRNYEQAISMGDRAFYNKQFKIALNKYFAAEVFDPSRKPEVRKKLDKVFQKIEEMRIDALEQKEAIQVIMREREREAKEKQNILEEKLRKEQEAKKAIEEKNRTAKLQQEGMVRLFASKAKEVASLARKRQFFGSAFRLSRDSLDNELCNDPTLIEAANTVLDHPRDCESIKMLFAHSYINDLAFGPNGELYAAGGINRCYQLDFKEFYYTQKQTVTSSQRLKAENGIGKLNAIALSPDGNYVACGGESGRIQLFLQNKPVKDKDQQNLLPVLHQGEFVMDLCFLDDKELCSLGADNHLIFYDYREQKVTKDIALEGNPYNYRLERVYLEESSFVATLTPESVHFFNSTQKHQISHPDYTFIDFTYDKKNNQCFILTDDQHLLMYKWVDGEFKLMDDRVLAKMVFAMNCNATGFLAIAYFDGTIEVWNNTTEFASITTLPIRLKQDEEIQFIAIPKSGNGIITTGKSYMQFHPIHTEAIYSTLEQSNTIEQLSLEEDFYYEFIDE